MSRGPKTAAVVLTDEERSELQRLVRRRGAGQAAVMRARIMLTVEANHVAHLVNEGVIARQLEGLGAVGLEPEGPPGARDHGLAHAELPGHGVRRPMRRPRGLRLQRAHDQCLDDLVADLARRPTVNRRPIGTQDRRSKEALTHSRWYQRR